MTTEGKIGLALGGAAIAYSIYLGSKIHAAVKTIHSAVHNVSELTEVDVRESVIEQAVQKAVDREVNSAVRRISRETVEAMEADIRNKVSGAVRSSYPEMQKAVTDAIAREAAKINVSDLKKDVIEKAKTQVAEKFDGQLDDLLEEFNNQLGSVSKIYQSIASSMSQEKSGGNGIVLKTV